MNGPATPALRAELARASGLVHSEAAAHALACIEKAERLIQAALRCAAVAEADRYCHGALMSARYSLGTAAAHLPGGELAGIRS